MSIKTKQIIKQLNHLAPEYLAQDWDNIGLQIGSLDSRVSKVLLALDATPKVVEEAIHIKADMIVVHHPMIFAPLKKIIQDESTGHKVYQLIKNNINLYVMHTNFDTAFGGTNDILGRKIGLSNMEVMSPDDDGMGIGRIGHIKQTTVKELSYMLKDKLQLPSVRVVSDLEKVVNKVAICTGSGMGFIQDAIASADVFITGDVKFHEAQAARDAGIGVIDVGHYGSENIAMPSIKEYLDDFATKNNIEVIVSRINEDPFTTL